MAIITLDDVGITRLGGQSYGQQRYELTDESSVTGGAFVMPMAPPRWMSSIRSPQYMALDEAAKWEALVLRLRGGINHLALYDMLRPMCRGNLRRTCTIDGSVAVGATSLPLTSVTSTVNLLAFALAFNGAAWTGTATVTANTATMPNGPTVNADTVADTSGSVVQTLQQDVPIADDSTTYTASVYVRKTSGGTAPSFLFRLLLVGGSSPTGVDAYINTDLGTVVGGAGVVQSVSSDYWRVLVTQANNATGNTLARVVLVPAAAPHNSATASAAQTGSVVVWGAQLEVGSSASALTLASVQPGDWLQVGTGVGTSQLFKAMALAGTGSQGTMSVLVEPPARIAFTGGTVVQSEMPVGYYKLRSPSQTWQAQPNGPAIDGFALDLLEQWA